MRIKKIYVLLLLGVGVLALMLMVYFFTSSRKPLSQETQSPTQPTQTTESSTSTAAPSSDQLETTLHTETQNLLKASPYTTVIDKSADFSAVTIYLDGTVLSITDKPFKYKGRLYLPLRQVGESLGIKIGFNPQYKVALAESNKYRLEMPLYYTKAIQMPLAAPDLASIVSIDSFNNEVSVLFYKEKTYLPVRFTAEALGFSVKYEEKENAVYFTSPQ